MQNIIETNRNLIETHCKICNKIYLRNSFDRNPDTYLCPECRKIRKNNSKKEKDHLRAEIIKQQRLEERNYEPYICLICGNPFIEDYRKSLKGVKKEEPKFCCQECAAKYSSHQINNKETKLAECIICHELKEINIHASSKNFICDECKENKKKEEKRNNENSVLHIPYRYPKDCVLGKFERSQAYNQKSPNLQKLGFNFEDFNWEKEFFKVRNLLYDLYYKQKLSALIISKKYNIILSNSIRYYLNLFGFFKIRNLSESTILAIKENRLKIPEVSKNNIYNQGQYKLKTGEEYFYRSNYELWMIQFLEARDIKFTLNQFHISYISSEDNEEHNGYPDFYLPDYNLLIETKGEDRYDEQNLIDRYETAIKKLKIDFIVIGCESKYKKELHSTVFKNWILLKSFLTDKEKEKEILKLLEII